MKHQKTITLLVLIITILSLVTTLVGIFSSEGPGQYEYQSIRGEKVIIHGKGLYQHMSAELAPQGIAQDIVTLCIGVPILLISLFLARKGSYRGKILLGGTLGYFLVTYLFYLNMAMLNRLFLLYIILLGTSFFAFTLTMHSFRLEDIDTNFSHKLPTKFIGGYLIFNSIAIATLWLQIVLPSLIYGMVPKEVEHYTTLIVQGLDLSLLLPICFIGGLLLIKKNSFGYLIAPVYLVFLSILMSALVAKIIAMASLGANVIPVIFIIPTMNLITILCTVIFIRNVVKN